MRLATELRQDPEKWHLWFAWHPIRTQDERKRVWFEMVWRIRIYYYASRGWEYDLLENRNH